MLTSFALNFMQEAFADNQGEIPVTVTQFAHTSIEKYKAQIDVDKKMTSAQKESLKQLADAYVQRDKNGQEVMKDGEPVWNVEEFKLCLDRIAGTESMLNAHEFYIGIINELKRNNDKLVAELTDPNKNVKLKEFNEEITTVKNQKPDEVVTVPHTWNNESWQAVVATYYPEAYKEFKGNLKPLVDAFRKAQGISFKSGIPKKGTKFNLDVIIINGKEYSPKADSDGSRLAKYTSNEEYGWGSKFFDPNWVPKSKGRAQSTVGERKVVHEATYTSTRKSDNKSVTGQDEKATQDALKPNAKEGTEINVTVTYSDGSQNRYKVKPEK